MSPGTTRVRSWLRKWSSLVSTVFLLVLCPTRRPACGQWDWMTRIGLGVPCVASVWFALRGRDARA